MLSVATPFCACPLIPRKKMIIKCDDCDYVAPNQSKRSYQSASLYRHQLYNHLSSAAARQELRSRKAHRRVNWIVKFYQWICDDCGQTVQSSSSDSLHRHIAAHHSPKLKSTRPRQRVQCDDCGKVFDGMETKSHLQIHLSTNHSIQKAKSRQTFSGACEECCKTFSQISNIWRHWTRRQVS